MNTGAGAVGVPVVVVDRGDGRECVAASLMVPGRAQGQARDVRAAAEERGADVRLCAPGASTTLGFDYVMPNG